LKQGITEGNHRSFVIPVHDRTRVDAGIFHHFHLSWINAISNALNDGRLPDGYYALAEQTASKKVPDVLALHRPAAEPDDGYAGDAGTSVAVAKPRVRITSVCDADRYAKKQNTIVIRHSSGDRIVALPEIVSQGNKSSKDAFRRFVQKLVNRIDSGYHVMVVDLQVPTIRDPNGIHGAIRDELDEELYTAPPDKPLTLASYCSDVDKTAYVEPIAVGDPLIEMPLFPNPDHYVNVPLVETYQTAWQHLPERWRAVIEPH